MVKIEVFGRGRDAFVWKPPQVDTVLRTDNAIISTNESLSELRIANDFGLASKNCVFETYRYTFERHVI